MTTWQMFPTNEHPDVLELPGMPEMVHARTAPTVPVVVCPACAGSGPGCTCQRTGAEALTLEGYGA